MDKCVVVIKKIIEWLVKAYEWIRELIERVKAVPSFTNGVLSWTVEEVV